MIPIAITDKFNTGDDAWYLRRSQNLPRQAAARDADHTIPGYDDGKFDNTVVHNSLKK